MSKKEVIGRDFISNKPVPSPQLFYFIFQSPVAAIWRMKCSSARIQWEVEEVTSLSDRWGGGDVSHTSLLSCVCTPGSGQLGCCWDFEQKSTWQNCKSSSLWLVNIFRSPHTCLLRTFPYGLVKVSGTGSTAHLLTPMTAWKNMPSVAVNISFRPPLSLTQ